MLFVTAPLSWCNGGEACCMIRQSEEDRSWLENKLSWTEKQPAAMWTLHLSVPPLVSRLEFLASCYGPQCIICPLQRELSPKIKTQRRQRDLGFEITTVQSLSQQGSLPGNLQLVCNVPIKFSKRYLSLNRSWRGPVTGRLCPGSFAGSLVFQAGCSVGQCLLGKQAVRWEGKEQRLVFCPSFPRKASIHGLNASEKEEEPRESLMTDPEQESLICDIGCKWILVQGGDRRETRLSLELIITPEMVI